MALDFNRLWSDEEVERFRNSWARFVEGEMLPHDAEARRRGHVGHELWRRAGELGFLCVDIPEEWGGAGGDFRHEAVLHEEMARRALSGMSIGVHSIAAHYLLNHGTDDQKRRYLPRLAKGELVGAIAMTEPGAGSDLQAIRTRAERHGNQYAISGSKTFISNGFLAGLVVVVCKTDPAERARGISLILVETEDCPGFRIGRLLDKIGRKAQDTAELFFEEVRVPADNLLGGVEGQGFYQLMADLPYERMMIGVGALAAMEAPTARPWTMSARDKASAGQLPISRTPGLSSPRSRRKSQWARLHRPAHSERNDIHVGETPDRSGAGVCKESVADHGQDEHDLSLWSERHSQRCQQRS